eukprot:COSAG01_NODE_2214_length_8156_cov_27.117910_3_plen_715_part_00
MLPIFAVLSAVATALVRPPVNVTRCEIESCLVTPTDCSSRSECQGCGALCFGSGPADPGWDLYLNNTGTSVQTGAKNVWDGVLAGGTKSHPAPLDGLLRTADIVTGWNSIQPKPPPAPYDWGDLPGAVERAHANGGRLIMLLWAGSIHSPDWIYDEGVEKIAENKDGGSVPNYLSPKYQELVKAVHRDLAAFLRSMAPANKAFMALQPCLGDTGDDTPFHPKPSWNVLDKPLEAKIRANWAQYYRNMSLFLQNDAFAPEIQAKQMVLLVNGEDSFPDDWVNQNLPGSFRKYGRLTHVFNENMERFSIAVKSPARRVLHEGRPMRARGELSAETCWSSHNSKGGKPVCDPPQKQAWGFYAMANFVNTAKIDFWNVQTNAADGIFNDTKWAPVWRLLNRYAGARWARQARGGWIAFRDGLDAMDSERFAKFGTLADKPPDARNPYPTLKRGTDQDKSNIALARAICKDHQARGCTIEDQDVLLDNQRHAKGVNDVAFGNWRGDYGGFLRLLNPRDTLGWWRLGSEQEMFGRYARGFAEPTNPDSAFQLALDRGLWGGLPLTAPKKLAVRLLFFDRGNGHFEMRYDGLANHPLTLMNVSKTNTNEWKEACAEVTDGRFGSRGPGGSDIWIRNADTEDDILGAIEIADASLDDIALKGCDFHLGVSPTCRGAFDALCADARAASLGSCFVCAGAHQARLMDHGCRSYDVDALCKMLPF